MDQEIDLDIDEDIGKDVDQDIDQDIDEDINKEVDQDISRSRASRLAEVSNYKKRAAKGSPKQVLPTGAATKPPTASQLRSLSSTSFCFLPFQV